MVILKDPEVKGNETEVTITIPKNAKDIEINNMGMSKSESTKALSCLPRKTLCNKDCSLDFGIKN